VDVRNAIEAAYVDGFRLVMFAAALLAAVSAGIAATTIRAEAAADAA